MTPRERIADWISGGKISHHRKLSLYFVERLERYGDLVNENVIVAHELREKINAALDEIARQKAPNATVRRIGRILQGAKP